MPEAHEARRSFSLLEERSEIVSTHTRGRGKTGFVASVEGKKGREWAGASGREEGESRGGRTALPSSAQFPPEREPPTLHSQVNEDLHCSQAAHHRLAFLKANARVEIPLLAPQEGHRDILAPLADVLVRGVQHA